MHTSIFRLIALPLSFLALAACGQASDPLSGTWSNPECYGTTDMPADIEECSIALIFTDALTVELQADWLSLPATADYPGCTTTKLVTGQTWSTAAGKDNDVLTISGNGAATVERSGCVNDSDNMEPTSTSGIEIPDGDINYEISGQTLTVLDTSLEGTYSK